MTVNEGPSEATLIVAARAGDKKAFNTLLAPHRDRLWGVCVRVTSNSADAEDAVQDALIAIWRGLGRFRGDAQFSTWAYRIASNAALAIVRKRRDLPLADDYEAEDTTPPFDEQIAVSDEIQAALKRLPEDFRVALVLREYGGLTYEEIAAHQGILSQTVKTRINRARIAVRAVLTETV
jgi:RNA polymerase sigma factor (sigma-70 family)